jgi:hypothetical protein
MLSVIIIMMCKVACMIDSQAQLLCLTTMMEIGRFSVEVIFVWGSITSSCCYTTSFKIGNVWRMKWIRNTMCVLKYEPFLFKTNYTPLFHSSTARLKSQPILIKFKRDYKFMLASLASHFCDHCQFISTWYRVFCTVWHIRQYCNAI